MSGGSAFGRTIAFFYALDADWKSLCGTLEATPIVRQWGGRTIFEIKAGADKIVAAKMESGCVQSAISAQAILTLSRIDMAVSVGPVGSLSSDFKIGEWAVVERIIPWQSLNLQNPDPRKIPEIEFEQADVRSAEITKLRRISVASGEQFISSQETGVQISSATRCQSVDMNLFGLATALSAHRVPSLHLRVASDGADEHANAIFQQFVKDYAGEGGRIVAVMIKSLPPDMTQPAQYPRLKQLLESPIKE